MGRRQGERIVIPNTAPLDGTLGMTRGLLPTTCTRIFEQCRYGRTVVRYRLGRVWLVTVVTVVIVIVRGECTGWIERFKVGKVLKG